MAIEEHDRENLLRDGKTMSVRGEATIDGVTVVVGFRDQGQASLYCGVDPVFQFNAQHQLRRVYYHGQRYAADNGNLVLLDRTSSGGRVILKRRRVSSETKHAIVNSVDQWIERIRASANPISRVWQREGKLDGPSCQAPSRQDPFTTQLNLWLKAHPVPTTIADSPNA
tara:strand:- start:295574 stop:296080 length:507 start_codon:yes stop_codon:yes gene_type:complete